MTMTEHPRKGKGGISIYEARERIGTYVRLAAVDGERTVVTRYGIAAAAIVSMRDLERLMAMDGDAA